MEVTQPNKTPNLTLVDTNVVANHLNNVVEVEGIALNFNMILLWA